jgi:exodeoxyribonuclease VII large subunit
MQTYSVQDLTAHIHNLFDADDILSDVWVQGEISNLTKAKSGHWYFSIKDANSQLRCVMFRNSAQYVKVNVETGDEILVHGRVSVYDARGEYQLYADQIEPIGGIGDLYRQFEELKTRLGAEGLFAEEYKQAIPSHPKKIGIVTSPTAAAFHDMQNVLRRRFPMVEVILSPTLVQGNAAPPEIVQAIERLNQFTNVDVILVARGGGSIEDLWCFNDERVARAIFASRIPIISGIGHEIDFTIADFVADRRAPTPSSAAEIATPNKDDLLMELDRRTMTLNSLCAGIITQKQIQHQQAQQRLRYATPRNAITNAQARVNNLDMRLHRATQQRMSRLRDHLNAKSSALASANPNAILQRGYAIVTDTNGNIIRSAQQVTTDDSLTIQLHDSSISTKVTD